MKKSYVLAILCCLGLLLCGSVARLSAQTESATINGRIADPQGNSVPAASVRAVNIDTNTEYGTKTNDAGIYVIPNVPPGRYRLLVRKEGFKEINKVNIELHVQDTIEQNFSLEIGSVSQSVTVTGSVTPVTTESAKLSATISNTMVQELPIVVGGALRSPLDLAVLTPEGKNYTTSVALGSTVGTNTGDSFSIGGGQPRAFGISLDGVTMMAGNSTPNSWLTYNTPPMDAITEFTVETNGYKAEFGHAQGGNMTFSSKSGTNAVHGSAFEFLRNNDMDANYFFSNKNHIPRSIYKQNDFGINAGGPVVIPHIIDGRNKLFFYAAYEGFRNRVGASGTSYTVPTAQMLQGNFSGWVNSSGAMIPIYDPSTTHIDPTTGNYVRTQFPGNIISTTQFDPLAVKAVSVFASGPGGQVVPNTTALPGTVGSVQNNYFVTTGTTVSPWNKGSVKGDWNINQNNRLSGYYGRTRETNTGGPDGPPQLPGYYDGYQPQHNMSDVFRVGWIRTISPTMVNSFFSGVNHWKQFSAPYQWQGGWKNKFCYPNTPNCDLDMVNLTFGGDGYRQWGSSGKSGSNQPVFSFNDNLTWSRGRHTLKFGGTYQRNYYDGMGYAGIAGIVGFATAETAKPGVTSFTSGGGNSFASFLLGQVDNGRIDTPRLIAQEYRYIAGFAQDDYHVNSKLTINFGLRWETTLPDVNPDNKLSNFNPTKPNPAANNIPGALDFAGFGPGRIGRTDFGGYNFGGFGPRLGLAYSVNSKTVIRSAYSRSFGFNETAAGSAHYAGFFQIYTPANTTTGVQPTWTFQNGFPTYPLPPIIDPSFANNNSMQWFQGKEGTRLPTIDSWTFSIQRELTPTTMIEVAYSGSKGTHLQSGLNNYNQVPFSDFQQYGATLLNSSITSPAAVAAGFKLPYPTFTGSVAQSLRPFPQYLTIDTAGGGGDYSGKSAYEALILQLQKRLSNGLTVQTSYVWSKLLTDSEGAALTNNAMDQARHYLEKSISGDDLTHSFKLAWIYELPLGKGKRYVTSGWGSALLGDWRVSAIQFYSSGFPVALGTTVALPIFAGPNRPTVPSNYGWGCSNTSNFDPSTTNFFQPASFFGTQPSTTFGNATRFNSACRQFPIFNENLSVNRKIRLTESVNLDIRMEGFNVFNRTRFGTGSTTIQSQTFGKLTSNNDIFNTPRQLQVAMRLNW